MKTQLKTETKGTVWSYLRFSHPAQQWGASERRQEDLAKNYCASHGLTLSEKRFADRGVSGWRGRNRQHGALGELLRVVRAGDSILLEDEDRLSRENPLTVLNLLRDIIAMGVSIITLRDGKVITKENFFELTTFLPVVLKATLANEENEKKSGRLLDAWQKRREDISKGKDRFGKLPFWLMRNKDGKIQIRSGQAANIVRSVFSMSAAGTGVRAIVETLNKANTPTFTRSLKERGKWNTSKVQNILHTPVVYGAFQSFKKNENGKREPIGDIVEKVFPVVITKEDYFEVKDKIGKRQKFFRGRYDRSHIHNLFTGLAKCGHCGASMIYSQKGKHGYLTCNAFHFSHMCQPGVLNYSIVEKVILEFIRDRASIVGYLMQDTSFDQRQGKIAIEKERIKKLAANIEKLTNLILETDAPTALVNKLRQLEQEQKQATENIKHFEQESRENDKLPGEVTDLLQKLLNGEMERIELRERIRRVIKSISVKAASKTFDVTWFKGRTDSFELAYTFKGCKPSLWQWRVKMGGISTKESTVSHFGQWSEWRAVGL